MRLGASSFLLTAGIFKFYPQKAMKENKEVYNQPVSIYIKKHIFK